MVATLIAARDAASLSFATLGHDTMPTGILIMRRTSLRAI
jgi:hypothetical protein